jgi:hypothetical protein
MNSHHPLITNQVLTATLACSDWLRLGHKKFWDADLRNARHSPLKGGLASQAMQQVCFVWA